MNKSIKSVISLDVQQNRKSEINNDNTPQFKNGTRITEEISDQKSIMVVASHKYRNQYRKTIEFYRHKRKSNETQLLEMSLLSISKKRQTEKDYSEKLVQKLSSENFYCKKLLSEQLSIKQPLSKHLVTERPSFDRPNIEKLSSKRFLSEELSFERILPEKFSPKEVPSEQLSTGKFLQSDKFSHPGELSVTATDSDKSYRALYRNTIKLFRRWTPPFSSKKRKSIEDYLSSLRELSSVMEFRHESDYDDDTNMALTDIIELGDEIREETPVPRALPSDVMNSLVGCNG